MHTLTSCLFIPSYMRILSEPHRRQLLQTYLLSICQVLITRGRPHIFPQEVMTYPTQPTGGFPLAQQGKLEAIGDPHQASQQNPWLEVISNAIAANGELPGFRGLLQNHMCRRVFARWYSSPSNSATRQRALFPAALSMVKRSFPVWPISMDHSSSESRVKSWNTLAGSKKVITKPTGTVVLLDGMARGRKRGLRLSGTNSNIYISIISFMYVLRSATSGQSPYKGFCTLLVVHFYCPIVCLDDLRTRLVIV